MNTDESFQEDTHMEATLQMLLISQEPAPRVWARISETLANEERPVVLPAPVAEPRRIGRVRSRILDWVAVAAAVVLLVAGLLAWQRTNQDSAPNLASHPLPSSDTQYPAWVADLKHADVQRRIDGIAGLVKAGPAVLPFLKQARAQAADETTRLSIDQIRLSIYETHPELALNITVENAPRTMELGTDTSLSLKVRVTNISDQPITLLKRNEASLQLSIWSTRVVDALGHAVEMDPLEHKKMTQEPFVADDFAVVLPGKSIEVPVMAYLFFQEPKPGAFRIDVVYAFDGNVACEPSASVLKNACLKCRLQAAGVTLNFVMPKL